MSTERRILNKVARACVSLENFGLMSPRDKAAISLAYTLCRVVVLGMNGLDQTSPGSARTGKSKMTLTAQEIRTRLNNEFKAVIGEVK